MDVFPTTSQLLKSYKIDLERGFLPSEDPLTTLPSDFKVWDDMAFNFSDYLKAGTIRNQLSNMPVIENPIFEKQEEKERAMLLLSFFAHAYVNSPTEKRDHIPPCISIPWVKIAAQLKRKPVIAHASLVLNNWRRLDKNKPIQLDNLATLMQFYGGLDESWFYLVTTQIEKTGAPAIPLLLEGIRNINNKDVDKARACLEQAALILKEMTTVLRLMYTQCEPLVFYKRIRPFIDSFQEVKYQGTSLGKQSFHGGSAAQSSLIQFFDAVLGNRYDTIPDTNHYLIEMRNYMPFKHAEFLRFIESRPTYKDYTIQHAPLETAFKEVMTQLIEFRNEHLKMVSIYIIQQARAAKTDAVGTGGTNPMLFLKSIRNKNQE